MEFHQQKVFLRLSYFDIDANGIVNVSTKDLGTGKKQNITITASSNLSDEDIDKAVRGLQNMKHRIRNVKLLIPEMKLIALYSRQRKH